MPYSTIICVYYRHCRQAAGLRVVNTLLIHRAIGGWVHKHRSRLATIIPLCTKVYHEEFISSRDLPLGGFYAGDFISLDPAFARSRDFFHRSAAKQLYAKLSVVMKY